MVNDIVKNISSSLPSSELKDDALPSHKDAGNNSSAPRATKNVQQQTEVKERLDFKSPSSPRYKSDQFHGMDQKYETLRNKYKNIIPSVETKSFYEEYKTYIYVGVIAGVAIGALWYFGFLPPFSLDIFRKPDSSSPRGPGGPGDGPGVPGPGDGPGVPGPKGKGKDFYELPLSNEEYKYMRNHYFKRPENLYGDTTVSSSESSSPILETSNVPLPDTSSEPVPGPSNIVSQGTGPQSGSGVILPTMENSNTPSLPSLRS